MISRRARLAVLDSVSKVVDRGRARAMSALALYLARPVDHFATLASHDQEALAAVLHRGDVLLCAGNTRCAEIVKRLTRSNWSHVSMYVGPMEHASDPLCVVEADIAEGVRAIRLSELGAHRVRVLRAVGLDDAERARLVETVLRHIGSGYDHAHAWQLARSLLLRRWWRRLRSVPVTMGRGATRFICSSLVTHAFAMIGHSLRPASGRTNGGDAGAVVPADFERAALFAIVWPTHAADA